MASPGRCTWAWCTGWTGLPPGVMVFARTSKAAERLSRQIQNGAFQKTYRAVVEGVPDDAGTFTDYLVKGEGNLSPGGACRHPRRQAGGTPLPNARSWEQPVLGGVDLVTGRPHQIRVQFASRGMPLVGDARYGSGGRQLALYATGISLIHPTKQERMDFVSDGCENRFNRLLRG